MDSATTLNARVARIWDHWTGGLITEAERDAGIALVRAMDEAEHTAARRPPDVVIAAPGGWLSGPALDAPAGWFTSPE